MVYNNIKTKPVRKVGTGFNLYSGVEFMLHKTIKLMAVVLSIACLLLCFCSCDGKKQTQSDNMSSVTSEIENTSSTEPAVQFFPAEFTTFKPQSGDYREVSIKGMAAIELDSDETIVFDPLSYERLKFPVKFTLTNGVTVGSKFEKLAEVYGLEYGTCVALDDEKVVDVKTISSYPDDVTVYSIIVINDKGEISYVAPSKAAVIANGFYRDGESYKNEANIGDNILIIEAEIDRGIIEELTVSHFVF